MKKIELDTMELEYLKMAIRMRMKQADNIFRLSSSPNVRDAYEMEAGILSDILERLKND